MQNQALFSLLGNRFGGDSRTTFGLPDLRGRVPVGAVVDSQPPQMLTSYMLGQNGGTPSVNLTVSQLPPHGHAVLGSSMVANSNNSQGNAYATVAADPPNFPNPQPLYGPASNLTAFDPSTVSPAGGGQAHLNMQPTLTLCYMIATQGIYPVRP
jgi:microcystin-dependent protein